MGTEHLLARGKTRICICAPSPTATADFSKGCVYALREAGVKPCGPTLRKYPLPDEMDSFCAALLACRPKPTAVIFGDSPVAAFFLRAALQRGVRVPQDLAVISYDYFAWADHLKASLTTIEQPLSEMASLTVDLVKRRLAEPSDPKIQHVLSHRLVIREST